MPRPRRPAAPSSRKSAATAPGRRRCGQLPSRVSGSPFAGARAAGRSPPHVRPRGFVRGRGTRRSLVGPVGEEARSPVADLSRVCAAVLSRASCSDTSQSRFRIGRVERMLASRRGAGAAVQRFRSHCSPRSSARDPLQLWRDGSKHRRRRALLVDLNSFRRVRPLPRPHGDAGRSLHQPAARHSRGAEAAGVPRRICSSRPSRARRRRCCWPSRHTAGVAGATRGLQ